MSSRPGCWHAWAVSGVPKVRYREDGFRPKISPRRRRLVTAVAEHAPQRVDGKEVAQVKDDTSQYDVQLRDVWLSYGNKPVLQGLNLKIRRGEATAIIGTSGTGKSTALRVITGLAVPDSGEVILRGWHRTKPISEEKGDVRVSMVFQNAALFDFLTVAENVAFGLMRERRRFGLKEEHILELARMYLRRVDMEEAFDKYPEELSGGMRKRASLARAVIHDPKLPETAPDILLYDEPTAGLDPTASTKIENMIRSLQDVCPTCVVVTHQFSTIRRAADRVVLMHEGTVAWDGPVHELDTTDSPFVRQFMSGSVDGPLNSADNRL